MNLFLIGIMLFVNIAIAFTSGLTAKAHNNVILENTLSPKHQTEPNVITLIKDYRKRLWQIAAIFSLLNLVMLPIRYDSILITLFWVSLIGSIATIFYFQITYIRKMHALIAQEGWQLHTDPLLIDTTLIQEKNRKLVPWYWFLGPLLFLLGSVLFFYRNGLLVQNWILLAVNFVLLILFVYSWYVIAQLPVKPLTNDEHINQRYNDLTKYYWSSITVMSSWLITFLFVLPLISEKLSGFSARFLMILFIGITMFLIGFTFYWLMQLRKKQDDLLSRVSTYRYYGEDQYWRYGIYINPNDNRLFIPDRIGMNISINLGKKAGKAITMMLGIVLAIAMYSSIVPLYILDFTADPISAQWQNQSLILKAPLSSSGKIELSSIDTVELVEKIPQPLIRNFGMATNDYLTGQFTADGHNAKLFVDLASRPILKIQTNDNLYYYTNKNPQETERLYQQLLKKLP